MRLHRYIITLALLAFPLSALAMQETLWDFTGSQVPGQWNVGGFEQAAPEDAGLHITSAVEGQIMHMLEPGQTADAVSILFSTPKETPAFLFWHKRDTPADTMSQVPFTIPAGAQWVHVNVSDYKEWDDVDGIGMALPGGVDVYLKGVRFVSWSIPEQIAEMAKSFWKFDIYEPYSINFLWGPIFTFNPAGTKALFDFPPPRGWSFGRILLPFLGLVGVACLVWFLRTKDRRRPFLIFAGTVIAAWLLFDLRMGLEFLSYARADYKSFIAPANPLERTLRRNGNTFGVIESVLPQLKEEPRFAVIAPPGAPYDKFARYLAYPSVPERGDKLRPDIRYWLVLERPDITLDAEQRLSVEGTPLTNPGKVVSQLSPEAFLFRVD